MCQKKGVADSLSFVLVDEDGVQESIDGGSVLAGSDGPGPSSHFPELSLDGVGSPDLLALGKGRVAEADEQIVEVVAQAGDGLGTGLLGFSTLWTIDRNFSAICQA